MTRAVIDTNLLVSGLLNDTDELDSALNTKHFPHKSYQGVRIIKVSKFLVELEKQFSN